MKTLAALAVLLASLIHADVINTVSITCTASLGGQSTITETYNGSAMSGGCPQIYIPGMFGGAADTNYSETVNETPGSNGFSAQMNGSLAINGTGGASQSVDLQLDFATAGPVRQGVLTYSAGCNNDAGDFPGNVSVNVDGLSPNLGQCFVQSGSVPVTLGGDLQFELQLFESVFGAGGGGDGDDEQMDGFLNVSVFEADGVTPVALLSTAPEPASAALIGAALLLLACRAKK